MINHLQNLGKVPLEIQHRVAGLERWHMIHMRNRENLATHSYLVAMNSMKVINNVVDVAKSNSDRTDIDWSDIQARTLTLALLHDVPETDLSDVSTVSKKAIGQSIGNPDFFYKMEEEFFAKFDVDFGELTRGLPALVVEAVDSFQALIFFLQNGDERFYQKVGPNTNISVKLTEAFDKKVRTVNQRVLSLFNEEKVINNITTLIFGEFYELIHNMRQPRINEREALTRSIN